MAADYPPQPSLFWRTASCLVMGITGSLSTLFMFGANSIEVHGLAPFLDLLNRRRDVSARDRGLITVSNHISVLDDPLIWGLLPINYHFNPRNHRWSLGSYDICFTNRLSSLFFTLGQVLPTHRIAHSSAGGLFQPTLTEAIRLLSHPQADNALAGRTHSKNQSCSLSDLADPFSCPTHTFTYSTNGKDSFPAPSAYASRRYSWLHIFPEGQIHQHAQKTMRYFKWGVARLILEADVCPDIVPMWIEGTDQIMHESRRWPRFVPRFRKTCGVWFGDNVGGEGENVFHDLRARWQRLANDSGHTNTRRHHPGDLDERMKYGKEAVSLREECVQQVRAAVLEVRRKRGLPDEDPKAGFIETWKAEGGKREGQMEDNSWVKDA